jgi:hypothetical protein
MRRMENAVIASIRRGRPNAIFKRTVRLRYAMRIAVTVAGGACAVPIAVAAGVPPVRSGSVFILRSDGLDRAAADTAKSLRFGMPRSAVVAAATAVLGKAIGSQVSPDCSIGHPMALVSYRGGLTLQFLNHKFVGWSLDRPADRRFMTAAGIGIGATLAAVRTAYPDIDIDDGPLGPMFTRKHDPSGFLDGLKPTSRVTSLYAGQTCMIW